MLYDVFICHASEDKARFVRPLAELLKQHRVEVWYDEFSLRVGDSLRRAIDIGLAKSRFGIVVFSPSFFKKSWPQWELDGLIQRQNSSTHNVILPIWHKVAWKDVVEYSPSLADKYAIRSNLGLKKVVAQVLEAIHPQGSTLLIARDRIMDYGYEPPVITDDWWMDVIEDSGSNDVEGTFQEAMGWGRWGFPLPKRSTLPFERGERLAWAALQMLWKENANQQLITQITPPDEVHAFITSQPGLWETCKDYLHYLLAYAPQLTIQGFGGSFEEDIQAMYEASCAKHEAQRKHKNRSGSALSDDGLHPTCHESLALRHPYFGNNRAAYVACNFVQGDLMGPRVKFYENIDYIAWLLSARSWWLPLDIRNYLLQGMKEWAVWPSSWVWRDEYNLGLDDCPSSDMFLDELLDCQDLGHYEPSASALRDLEARLAFSAKLLRLVETGDELATRFLTAGFIEAWLQHSKKRDS